MLRILVCFKVVAEAESVLEGDWAAFQPGLDLSYAKRSVNCFDESALELALRLRDETLAAGGEAECTALTLGAQPPASLVKTLYAAGFARVVLLRCETVEFAPATTAALLAGFAAGGGYNLVLAGRQAGYADSGQVPALLAGMLNLAYVPELQNAIWRAEGVELECATDLGTARLLGRAPLLAAVGNSPAAALRATTLRDQLAAGSRPLEVIETEAPAPAALPVVKREQVVPHCEMLRGSTPAEWAGALVGSGLLEGGKA